MQKSTIEKIVKGKRENRGVNKTEDKNYYHSFKFKYNFKDEKNEVVIIDELRRLSGVWVKSFDRSRYERLRRKVHNPYGLSCWICRKNNATCFHHIIQLNHGGYDCGWNRIAVCNVCHTKIHPWLCQ